MAKASSDNFDTVYETRKKDFLALAAVETDSVRRAHFQRQARCRELLEPLTERDDTARLKRQQNVIDMLSIGAANKKYASENAGRLAAENAQRWADKAAMQAKQLKDKASLAKIKVEPKGDDLTEITGVGPATARKLADYGVNSFAKLAGLDGSGIARAKQALGAPNADVEDWVEQAKEIIAE